MNLSVDDLPQMIDAFFHGEPEGWVVIAANAHGRTCVERVFPAAYIQWREHGGDFPTDWQGFSPNLPDIASATQHHLPPINDVPLDEATPDQLAYLLAIATKNQGARAGLLTTEGELHIFTPDSGR
jgi:hypothetical protein